MCEKGHPPHSGQPWETQRPRTTVPPTEGPQLSSTLWLNLSCICRLGRQRTHAMTEQKRRSRSRARSEPPEKEHATVAEHERYEAEMRLLSESEMEERNTLQVYGANGTYTWNQRTHVWDQRARRNGDHCHHHAQPRATITRLYTFCNKL